MLAEKAEYTVTSNVQGDKIAMGFDEEAVQHLMGLLTNLYADSEQAVIREYTTNARDSHVEAGQSRPIDVILPSALDPTFKVKDYGVGLSAEDIREIYSKYGASTKRDTNEQTGMLGVGCKSALAYTSQFTLIGIKDGERIAVMVSRDESGGGNMTVLEQAPTDEPNGVEVAVPAKPGNAFERKARNFFRYWEPGTVLINGEEPEHQTGGLALTDKITVHKTDHGDGRDLVIMGNVPYPILRDEEDNGWTNHLPYGYYVVAHVDMCDVSFTPSREALHYTKHTKQTLTELAEAVEKGLVAAVAREVAAADSEPEAVKVLCEWQSMIRNINTKPEDFKYKGKVLPQTYDDNDGVVIAPHSHGRGKQSKHERTKTVDIQIFPSSVWVYEWDRDSFSAHQKKQLKKWAEENQVETEYYVLTKTKPDCEWIDESRLIPWSNIKTIKIPRSPRTTNGKVAGQYELLTSERSYFFDTPATDIDPNKPLFYGQTWQVDHHYEILQANYDKDLQIVRLPPHRVAKFKRTFPMAKPITDEAKRLFSHWAKKITPRKRKALAVQQNDGDDYEFLNPVKLDDPALRKYVRYAQLDLTKIQEEYKLYRRNFNLETEQVEDPFENYPLYDRWTAKQNLSHTYLYLNAVYAARKDK